MYSHHELIQAATNPRPMKESELLRQALMEWRWIQSTDEQEMAIIRHGRAIIDYEEHLLGIDEDELTQVWS